MILTIKLHDNSTIATIIIMVENIGGKNIGEISFLDYLEGKTLADRLQIKYEY